MKAILTLFCLLSISLTIQASAEFKKNACTITINSSEEANLFKANLSPRFWNFIELAPHSSDPNNKDWFVKSCQPNIQCDILIISGHFGGSFFGSTNLQLSMEELEKNSCDQRCDGILKKPKEVFLFGCNTLASKEKDHRTPEQYMQVLLNDGFSVAQASQIVSFRYSGFGDSYKYRMSQVFSSTPRIYGFSSVGPSGKTIEPLLKNYLQSNKSQYENFDAYNKIQLSKLNHQLFFSLRTTSLLQVPGLFMNVKNPEQKPYCYIRDESKSRLERLLYVKKLFAEKKAVQLLDHIQEFLHQAKSQENLMSPEEFKIWSEFSTDARLKIELVSLLNLNGDIYLPLKANILNTLKDLNLVSEEFVNTSFNQMVDLNTPFTEIRRSMLCSLNLKINIPAVAVPMARWQEVDFISAMLCLKPQDILFQLNMNDVIQSASANASARASAIWFFYGLKTDRIEIQKTLANLLIHEADQTIRQSAAIVLLGLKPKSPEILDLVVKAIAIEKDPYIRLNLNSILK